MITRVVVAVAAMVGVACVASLAPAASATSVGAPGLVTAAHQYGSSSGGTPIRVVSRGRAIADVDVLVIGVIHGNERAGLPVVRRLGRTTPPPRVRYWLAPSINPDGQRRGTRHNGRGVDLNRNFPFGWRGGGSAFDTYYPGPARASEPETRAVLAMVRDIRPDVTIWYHQHLDMVLRPALPWRVALADTYAGVARMRMLPYPGGTLYGTATSWQAVEQPYGAALVVELPAGSLDRAALARHVAAVRAISVAATRDRVEQPDAVPG